MHYKHALLMTAFEVGIRLSIVVSMLIAFLDLLLELNGNILLGEKSFGFLFSSVICADS